MESKKNFFKITRVQKYRKSIPEEREQESLSHEEMFTIKKKRKIFLARSLSFSESDRRPEDEQLHTVKTVKTEKTENYANKFSLYQLFCCIIPPCF